ncbi:MAG: response regulator transcription factor, partial [Anaerolineaceae bacterium]|nr:response regulator transcription factor [Anaerolineaceae bacterium]
MFETIHGVMRGKTWLSPTVAEVVTESLAEARANGEKPLLTCREVEILQLLGRGCTNDQIGKELFISERTVRFHLERLLEKLTVHNRTEA